MKGKEKVTKTTTTEAVPAKPAPIAYLRLHAVVSREGEVPTLISAKNKLELARELKDPTMKVLYVFRGKNLAMQEKRQVSFV